jgi:hypothetical protein
MLSIYQSPAGTGQRLELHRYPAIDQHLLRVHDPVRVSDKEAAGGMPQPSPSLTAKSVARRRAR